MQLLYNYRSLSEERQSVPKVNGAPASSVTRHIQIHPSNDNRLLEYSHQLSRDKGNQGHSRQGSDDSTNNVYGENTRWTKRSLKRSSSYTNAVMIDLPENRGKYDSGNYYIRLPTKNPDDSVT